MEEYNNGQGYQNQGINEENNGSQGGWTYSANTNQYGQNRDNATWQNSEYHQSYQQNRQEYGTQYGYYGQRDNNQWDFNRYESKSKTKKKSGSGFKIFIITVCILLGLCVISTAVFLGYSFIKNKSFGQSGFDFSFGDFDFGFDTLPGFNGGDSEDTPNGSGSDGQEQSGNESSSEGKASVEAPELPLGSKPDDGAGENSKLSSTEIYKMVNPSIVGVITYQYSVSMDPTGSGSGVILSEDGYIVTNAHVVSGAEAVKIVLYNEEEYEATVIGSDNQTDIAVLKISAPDLVAASLGDSSMVEVGEKVYVLGNPGGLTLQSSFTMGIISGLNRTITTSDSKYPMTVLQTDAAINPGNSGGALINEYGQVIGITSSKLVSEKYEGVGFAIPTATGIPIAQELIEKGYISGRAILGITGRTIDETTAKYYSVPQGIQIISINGDSAFKGTEAKVGDIITAVNGKGVSTMEELQQVLATMSPGMEADITLYRYAAQRENDKSFTVRARLIESKG